MTRRNRSRLLHSGEDDNPLELLANLFDAAMVFAVALMVAIVSHFSMSEIFSSEDCTIVKNPGTPQMEIVTKKGGEVTKLSASDADKDNSSRGERVGTAYRLESGQIIYIPD